MLFNRSVLQFVVAATSLQLSSVQARPLPVPDTDSHAGPRGFESRSQNSDNNDGQYSPKYPPSVSMGDTCADSTIACIDQHLVVCVNGRWTRSERYTRREKSKVQTADVSCSRRDSVSGEYHRYSGSEDGGKYDSDKNAHQYDSKYSYTESKSETKADATSTSPCSYPTTVITTTVVTLTPDQAKKEISRLQRSAVSTAHHKSTRTTYSHAAETTASTSSSSSSYYKSTSTSTSDCSSTWSTSSTSSSSSYYKSTAISTSDCSSTWSTSSASSSSSYYKSTSTSTSDCSSTWSTSKPVPTSTSTTSAAESTTTDCSRKSKWMKSNGRYTYYDADCDYEHSKSHAEASKYEDKPYHASQATSTYNAEKTSSSYKGEYDHGYHKSPKSKTATTTSYTSSTASPSSTFSTNAMIGNIQLTTIPLSAVRTGSSNSTSVAAPTASAQYRPY